MAHAWAVTNALASLASTAFTFTNWTASNKTFLNDAGMDRVCSTGAATGTTRYIDIDLGSAQALVGFALLNHNLASWNAPKLTIKAADDSGFSVNLVTPKAQTNIVQTEPNAKDCVLQFASVTKRYWRLQFDSGSTEAIRLGELFAASSLTSLMRTKAYGHGEQEEHITNRAAMRTGNVRGTYLAGPIRTKRLPFVDMQGATQREELMTMWRTAKGDATPLLWVEYVESTNTAATDAAQECLYGKLQPALGWREPDFTIYDVDALELRSLGRDVGR